MTDAVIAGAFQFEPEAAVSASLTRKIRWIRVSSAVLVDASSLQHIEDMSEPEAADGLSPEKVSAPLAVSMVIAGIIAVGAFAGRLVVRLPILSDIAVVAFVALFVLFMLAQRELDGGKSDGSR